MSRRPPSKAWHPPLKPDDVALWEDVKKTVKRLPKKAAAKEKPAPPKADKEPPKPLRLEKKAAGKKPAVRMTAPMPQPQPPQVFDRTTLRKIKSGRIRVDDTLDLHGMRQEAAHRALTGFIGSAQQHGYKLVLVITGKGGRFSKSEEGVLRQQLPRWLKETDLSRKVLSFSKASVAHGGDGAFYVRLRKRS